jgi:exopolyphosphatase / guanosine-5'-triphosphate,3'-diphosphate pyrophosphatase
LQLSVVILAELVEAPAPALPASDSMTTQSDLNRRAIIDVGSNSVRLVIYDGPARTPFVVHNEKVQARLGRSLAETGRIDAAAYDKALKGCRRFKALLDTAGIADVRTVATAAARDAENGPALLSDLREIGLDPELLSGDAEANGSASGVISAFPGADGIVGDLGGGSLELVDVRGGNPGRRETFPLGVLRLPALRSGGDKEFCERIAAQLQNGGWMEAGAGRCFYLVGGSWRALGHLDMHLSGSSLPGVHGYAFSRNRITPMRKAIAELGPQLAKVVPGVSSSRAAVLDDAALLLEVVADSGNCERMVVSTFGLREGLLYSALDPDIQRQDPLLAAVIDYALRRGNPTWRGDVVAAWIAPIFADENPAHERIRRAACHLAGVDLHPQSETRARHGMELAWLGAWIGLSAEERGMLAQAMWTAWSGKGQCAQIEECAPVDSIRRAMRWGEAIRLAERLSGGATTVLRSSDLSKDGDSVILAIDNERRDLGGQVVAKQLAGLSDAMGASSRIIGR